MAGFLYYVPGDHQHTHKSLAAIGFPHADIAGTPGCGCNVGPDGVAGYVFEASYPCVDGAKSARVGYYPDTQTWHQCDGWWLGWETDNAPRPIDVQRVETRRGYACTLADDSTWIVPVVREHTGFPALPTVRGADSNGKVTFSKVEPQYARLWALTEIMCAEFLGETERAMPDEEGVELVSLAVGLNYHVTKWELLHLGLISTSALTSAYAAILDLQKMRTFLEQAELLSA